MAYSEDQKKKLIDSICEGIEKGASLRTMLSVSKISSRTFFKWIDLDENKVKQYARAMELRADKIFEDILDIADSQENDIITLSDGRKVTNHDVINRARLRVDARKWMLSKMFPTKYGDKIEWNINREAIKPVKYTKASEYIAEMKVSKAS